MRRNKSIAVVAVSAILFGVVSKCLVGLPYMVWGQFDISFILSFILWTLYPASLYLAGQKNDRKEDTGKTGIGKTEIGKASAGSKKSQLRTCFCAVLFGIMTAAAKTGLDAAILRLLGNTDDLLLLSFAMGIGIIVSGCIVMAVLHCIIFKRKFVWKRSCGKYVGILSGMSAFYGIAFLYFQAKLSQSAPYTDLNALAEGRSLDLNFMMGLNRSMKYYQEFTVLSMLVYVVFFIVFWIIMQKGTDSVYFIGKRGRDHGSEG